MTGTEEEGSRARGTEYGGDGYIEEEFSPTDPDPQLVGGVRIPRPDCDGKGHRPGPAPRRMKRTDRHPARPFASTIQPSPSRCSIPTASIRSWTPRL